MEMTQAPIDVATICRTCLLEDSELESIFDASGGEDDSGDLCDLLEYCTSIKVSHTDMLPTKLCDLCAVNLRQVCLFKQLCLESDAILREELISKNQERVTLAPYTCRTCRRADVLTKFKHLFTVNEVIGETARLNRMLKVVAISEMSEADVLPSQVCPDCANNITQSFLFIHTCRQSDNTLRRFLRKPVIMYEDCIPYLLEPTQKGANFYEKEFMGQSNDMYLHYLKKSEKRALAVNRPKFHKCKECKKLFKSHSKLVEHERFHTGERPYKCTLCPKNFVRSVDLKVHMNMHNGTPTYFCKYCQKGFYRHTALKLHLRIHTGEKPFQCEVCEKRYYCKSNLRKHLRMHEKYMPRECDK